MSGSGTSDSPEGTVLGNGICAAAKTRRVSEDWWYEDVSFLRLSQYKRLILAVESSGIKPESEEDSWFVCPLCEEASSFVG